MPIPSEDKILSALLEELDKAGGVSKSQDIIEKLAQRFQLTASERELRDPTGERTFDHRVHAAVERARRQGLMDPVKVSGRGIWKLRGEVDIWERLAAVEDAANKLKEQDLLITKMVSLAICRTTYNMFVSTRKGEELDEFLKLWRRKLEDTQKEIEDSRTVERALGISLKFDKELIAYVKAAKVDTADKAMEIAHSFTKKYSPVALPLKAEREGDVWLVDIDVGALAVKVAKVKIDARTGDILSYEIPPK